MKNLANCKPSEFLIQTNKIRKSVANWLTVTDILNIRKRLPELEEAGEGATTDERQAVVERNLKKKNEQVKQNLMDILDAMLVDHPMETLEILALCCFVEPEDVDNHPMSEYIGAITELIETKEVMSFFISLAKLAKIDI